MCKSGCPHNNISHQRHSTNKSPFVTYCCVLNVCLLYGGHGFIEVLATTFDATWPGMHFVWKFLGGKVH